jgi:transposase
MKIAEEIMEILEAFDLVDSLRDAGELAGCSHNTVARYVELREAGKLSAEPARRVQLIDPYLDKLEEWMETSKGKLRADRAHKKLEALGFSGSPRTTRRAVAAARRNWSKGNRRLYRPWIPEPGMWFQWDFGDGPTIEGRKTWLFCAWLSWSRFRVVLPIWDKTLPTVIACIDTTLRCFGGVPTYSLTDNEKTVTTDIVARIPIRHPEIVAAGAHYGLTIHTCVVADPESKGGSEASVRIAKADLVPTEANLLEEYPNFAAFEEACEEWCDETNNKEHRSTRRSPVDMLAEERQRLHRLPDVPYSAAPVPLRTGVGARTRGPGRLRPRRSGRPGRGGPARASHTGEPELLRRALRPDPRRPAQPHRPAEDRRRRRLLGPRRRSQALAERSRSDRRAAGAGQDGRRRRPGGHHGHLRRRPGLGRSRRARPLRRRGRGLHRLVSGPRRGALRERRPLRTIRSSPALLRGRGSDNE